MNDPDRDLQKFRQFISPLQPLLGTDRSCTGLLTFMATNDDTSFAAILQKYDQFVNEKLKPDLKATLDARDTLYDLTSE